MKKYLLLLLGIGVIVLLGFSLKAKPIVKSAEHYYIPPDHCYMQMDGFSFTSYLKVTGINSTVFCRRVLSSFVDDYVTITDINSIPDDTSMCSVDGEGFKVEVVGDNKFSIFFCKALLSGVNPSA